MAAGAAVAGDNTEAGSVARTRRTLPPAVRSLALVAESLDTIPAALVVRHLLAAVRVILSPVMQAEDLHLRSEPEEIALAVDHSRFDRGPHVIGQQSQNLGIEDLAELACLPAACVRVVIIHGVGIAQAILEHKLKENGVELRYATTDIPKGPEGIILESIMEGWAEYYSAELSRKIKRGMRESALKCHSTGAGRCLGYRTAEDKSLVIEPEGAKAVQTVFDMYIKGKSHADICRYLNDCGFRTAQGKLFNKNSVTHIIRNKRYIGVYTYDDIMIEDGIPAIISKDTFHLAQLEAARRKTAKRPKEPKAEYLLSGKAFCGHCQKPLVGVSGTGKSGNKWYYYYCQESRAKRGCTKKPVKRDWLEREVVERTVAEVLQPEVIQHIAKKCYDLQMEYRQDNSDVLFYELKLKDVRKAIKNTMHAIESGVKTKTLPARLQELENEEEALEAELAIAKASDFVITTDQIEFLLTQFAEPWECESEEEYHRRIIKCFVHKVFLFDDKLLIYYNVSRDGKTREQSEAELLEEALGEGFDKRSSGSTMQKRHPIWDGVFAWLR